MWSTTVGENGKKAGLAERKDAMMWAIQRSQLEHCWSLYFYIGQSRTQATPGKGCDFGRWRYSVKDHP